MRLPTAVAAVACVALVAFYGACAAAETQPADAVPLVPAMGKSPSEENYLISGIIEQLLRPLKKLLAMQIRSIIRSIIDQGGAIIGTIKDRIDNLVEIIRPFIIRMIDRLNDIIGAGVDIREKIGIAIEKLFKYLGVINSTNKEIVKLLINYIKEKLLGGRLESEVSQQQQLAVAGTAPLLLSGIKDWLIRPIVRLVRRQIEAVLRSLLDQTGHIADRLLEHVGLIAELIRPSVIRILDITGNLHGEIDHLRQSVNEAVVSILGNLSSIGQEGQKIVLLLIEKVTDSILQSIIGSRGLTAAGDDAFLIIDKLIGWILRPILRPIDAILTKIRALINDKTEAAKAKLLKLYDELTLLLKRPVVRIIGMLSDIGVEIGDTAAAVKRALEMIVDSISGIAQENKKMLKAIMSSILERLADQLKKSDIVVLKYSILVDIINRIVAPIVSKINDLLDSLRAEIEGAIGGISEIVEKYVGHLANLLSPFVASIVRLIEQLGLGGRDLVENVRRTLEVLVNSASGIAEANRQLLGRLLDDLLKRIVERVIGSGSV